MANFKVIDDINEYIVGVEDHLKQVCLTKCGQIVIGVSGGSAVDITSKALISLHRNGHLKKCDIFFCDERVVPENDNESIYGAYSQCKELSSDFCHFHKVNTSLNDVDMVAKDYEEQLKGFFQTDSSVPTFDMLLCGMGDDGHTCSLFPGHVALDVKDKWVTGVTGSPKPPPLRVTLTYPVINAASFVLFLVRGAGKANAVKNIIRENNSNSFPAGRVLNAFWMLDSGSASHL